MKQESLRPQDVAVLLQLALRPRDTFRDLAAAVGLSLGETHSAVKRLELAGLAAKEQGSVNGRGMREFLLFGVPYAFPAVVGPERRGIPTGFAASSRADEISGAESWVWPSAAGTARGPSLAPLCPGVADIWERNAELYELLVLVDAVRGGRARERARAREALEVALDELAEP
jgi:DNA-binding Lrp family transcriptional regulator